MSAKRKNTHIDGQQPPRTGVALLATFFKEQMEQTETIMIQGRRKSLSLLEITAMQLLNRALSGDERAIRDLLALVKKAETWGKNRRKRQILLLLGDDAYL
jgi:hypothetical protein